MAQERKHTGKDRMLHNKIKGMLLNYKDILCKDESRQLKSNIILLRRMTVHINTVEENSSDEY